MRALRPRLIEMLEKEYGSASSDFLNALEQMIGAQCNMSYRHGYNDARKECKEPKDNVIDMFNARDRD